MRFLSFSGARRPGRNSALPVSRDRAPAVGASIRAQYDAAAPLPRTCPTHVGVKLNDQAMTHQPTDRRTGQNFFRKKKLEIFFSHMAIVNAPAFRVFLLIFTYICRCSIPAHGQCKSLRNSTGWPLRNVNLNVLLAFWTQFWPLLEAISIPARGLSRTEAVTGHASRGVNEPAEPEYDGPE
jgi:hypothetical protein